MTDSDRFQIEPHYKQSRRYYESNPSGQVKDGYLVTDTLTEATRRVDLKREAVEQGLRTREEESTLDWSGVAHYDFPEPRHWQSLIEIYAYSADGERLTPGRGAPLVVVGADSDQSVIEARVARWLEAMGRPEITRLPH